MKTFKLLLLIVVLLTTTLLMVEGVKVNLLAQPTVVSSASAPEQTPFSPSVRLR
ncbi:MAG: hypothetical protein SH818_00805 [Saprospiraceae bacterium]|nr:hypothetical protein [Saprospiraceae bacterium]